MKRINFLFLAVLGLLGISCSSGGEEDPEIHENRHEVSFKANLKNMSRASDTDFDTNDKIGVFAVLADQTSEGTLDGYKNYADNVMYTYNGSKFTADNGIAIDDDGQKYYYHAVYPYVEDACAKFTFQVQLDQRGKNYTLSDLCTANTTATAEDLVHLTFSHRLSKLIFNLKGNNWPAGDISLTVNGVKYHSTVYLNALDFVGTGSYQNVVCSDNGTKSFKVILPPQQISKSEKFITLTIGDKTLTGNIGKELVLESGKQIKLDYEYTSSKVVNFSGNILPWDEIDERLNDVVPPDIRKKLEKHINIYTGTNPPMIEGVYFIDPMVAVYCEDESKGGFHPGDTVVSTHIRFSNQNTRTNQIDYEEKNKLSFYIGKGAFISGQGNNFTAFFNTEGTTKSIWNKTALVISGTKTNTGIKNLEYAFIMVDKGSDPNHELMDKGIFRVFKDEDGLTVNSTWPSTAAARKSFPAARHTYSSISSKSKE